MVKAIQHHLESISEIAANRTVVKRHNKLKFAVPVRNMSVSFTDAYMSFSFNKEISFSAFYKNKGIEKPKNVIFSTPNKLYLSQKKLVFSK